MPESPDFAQKPKTRKQTMDMFDRRFAGRDAADQSRGNFRAQTAAKRLAELETRAERGIPKASSLPEARGYTPEFAKPKAPPATAKSMTSEEIASRAKGRIEARMAADRRPAPWIKEKAPALQTAVAKRVSDAYDTAKAATKTRVSEGMQATAKIYDDLKAKSYVAEKLAQRAKAAATKAAPVVEAVATKAAPAARAAAPLLKAVGKRLPAVGAALDVAATGAAVYQGAKASKAHSDLTRTAKSLEKHGVEVETPSFNPLKAAFPKVFGEHPEVKVKAKSKGKLGS